MNSTGQMNGPALAIPMGQLATHAKDCATCRLNTITFAVWVICTSKCGPRDLFHAENLLCPEGRELVRAQRRHWAELDRRDAERAAPGSSRAG